MCGCPMPLSLNSWGSLQEQVNYKRSLKGSDASSVFVTYDQRSDMSSIAETCCNKLCHDRARVANVCSPDETHGNWWNVWSEASRVADLTTEVRSIISLPAENLEHFGYTTTLIFIHNSLLTSEQDQGCTGTSQDDPHARPAIGWQCSTSYVTL